MRVGVYSDGLPHLSRAELLGWCAEREVDDVELGVGTWGPKPRPHLDLGVLLRDGAERDRLRSELADHGLGLSAINAAGNVLHPAPTERAEAQARLRGAVDLARLLDVDRVVTMAGCPGERAGGSTGIFAVWSTVADDEGLWEWQFEREVAPFWRELSREVARDAPAVQICLELHAGLAVYNPATYARLRELTGPNIGINLDPSHFWWQGIDPVAVIEAVAGRIGHAHGKDTTIYPERVRVNGLLDHAYPPSAEASSWHFSPVGDGHDDATWAGVIAALRAAGFDGTVSIEHEDPALPAEESIERSIAGLRRALAR